MDCVSTWPNTTATQGVEATPAHRTAEVESTKLMVDRVEERFDLKPERLIADTAYGTRWRGRQR